MKKSFKKGDIIVALYTTDHLTKGMHYEVDSTSSGGRNPNSLLWVYNDFKLFSTYAPDMFKSLSDWRADTIDDILTEL